MRSVLYRPSWQKLRVSFLAGNHPNQGFLTVAGTDDNLQRLNNYIQDADPKLHMTPQSIPEYVTQEIARMHETLEGEHAARIWRGLNLLNAVRMGFRGQGKANSPEDTTVGEYRDKLSALHNGHEVMKIENSWNWDVVRFEYEEMRRQERYWFTKIHQDLRRRGKVAHKRRSNAGGATVEDTRPELIRVVQMLDEINAHAGYYDTQ